MEDNVEMLTLDDMKRIIGEQMGALLDTNPPYGDAKCTALMALAVCECTRTLIYLAKQSRKLDEAVSAAPPCQPPSKES